MSPNGETPEGGMDPDLADILKEIETLPPREGDAIQFPPAVLSKADLKKLKKIAVSAEDLAAAEEASLRG